MGRALGASLGLGTLRAFSLSASGAFALVGCMASPRRPSEPIQDSARLSELVSRNNEPTIKTGQAWEFQAVNVYNGVSLGSVLYRVDSSTTEGLRLALIGEGSTRHETFKEPWKLTQEAHHDATLRFESPVGLIPAQLSSGFEERYATRYVVLPNAGSEPIDTKFRDLYWQVYLVVQGWETLQVPAGRFEVARIRRRIFFKHFDTFRSESSRVETLWYAPKLGMWVAREWTGQYLAQGSRRRGGLMREDWVRWELQRVLGQPLA
jgi:hypothetical protein